VAARIGGDQFIQGYGQGSLVKNKSTSFSRIWKATCFGQMNACSMIREVHVRGVTKKSTDLYV